MAFLDHINTCSQKIKIGVNYHPHTPNIFRVVEMQALNEALSKAYPDYDPSEYPWPDHEFRLMDGKGWITASPAVKSWWDSPPQTNRSNAQKPESSSTDKRSQEICRTC